MEEGLPAQGVADLAPAQIGDREPSPVRGEDGVRSRSEVAGAELLSSLAPDLVTRAIEAVVQHLEPRAVPGGLEGHEPPPRHPTEGSRGMEIPSSDDRSMEQSGNQELVAR